MVTQGAAKNRAKRKDKYDATDNSDQGDEDAGDDQGARRPTNPGPVWTEKFTIDEWHHGEGLGRIGVFRIE